MRVSVPKVNAVVCLLLMAGVCVWLGAGSAGATPVLEWNGNQTVTGDQTVQGTLTVAGQTITGSQTVTGGVNVGSSTDAATAQVKIKSSTSPSVVWQSTYLPGSTSLKASGSAIGVNWAPGDDQTSVVSGLDGGYAEVCGYTNPLNTSLYGFSVPTGATITGVEVSYRIKMSSGAETVNFQLLANGLGTGNSKGVSATASWTTGTLGSSSDIWDGSVTAAVVNGSGFGVKTWRTSTPGTGYQVDYLKIKVYYAMGGHWTAGSCYADGSWRVANNVATLLANTRLTMTPTGYFGIGAVSPTRPLHMAGGAYCTGTSWITGSCRASKLNISPVPAPTAWDLLDQLQPVDFEYRKTETQYKLKDGSVVRERPTDANDVVEEVTAWTDEGSGEFHRGFIAEEVPAPLTRGDGIAALDIAANNTAALKEAKRRILDLERRTAALMPRGSEAAGVGTAGSDAVGGSSSTPPTGATASAIPNLLSDLSNLSDPSHGAVRRLTGAVLEKLGVEPWVEIPADQAWEEADETTPVSSTETVTKYRFNSETRAAEVYTVEVAVTRQVPTGRRVIQLKPDVRLDENTGRFYRWCGIGGATTQRAGAALLGRFLPCAAAVLNGFAKNAAISRPCSLQPEAYSLESPVSSLMERTRP